MAREERELVTCPECGVKGEVCLEMAWHVERCAKGVRLSSRGALRERWEQGHQGGQRGRAR